MSCTISELPSGCRLRGMGSGSQSAANAPLMSGGDISGNSGGGPNAIHLGINNTLQETPRIQQQSQKSCCLCWCCCCSCSWAKCLAIKNAEDNGPTKRNPATSDLFSDGEQPTIDEIRGWGESFDSLMKSSSGRRVFRDFLRCEYSEENILFWLACEDLKTETSPEVVEEKARLIYEEYISILSPKEVSLDSRVREIVNRNMVEPTPHTFDEAQIQIYTLMHRDSYPRFINSQLFKSLAQFPEGMSTSGSSTDIVI